MAPSACARCSTRPSRSRASQIERILERGQDDEALTQVGAVIKPLPQGILRDGLIRLASSRLGISPDLVESAVRTARPQSVAPEVGGAPRTANGARQAIDRREQSERAFLSLCVALPELGEQKLAAVDLDAVFTGPLTRLAAERLRGHLAHPSSVIGDAPELAELIPEIVLRAGQLDATPATLELEALQLDLHRLDREITAARTGARAPSEPSPPSARRCSTRSATACSRAKSPSDTRTSVRVMDRDWLEAQLTAGRSIESIAREVGKHPSTVGYWLKKHGLTSHYAELHGARGSLARDQLAELVRQGLSIREIGQAVGEERHDRPLLAARTTT